MVNNTNHRLEMKTTVRWDSLTPIRMTIFLKKINASKDMEKRESWYTIGVNINWYTMIENRVESSQKINK